MSERYKVLDSHTPNFVTLTLIGWVDLLVKPIYCRILDDALNYCIQNKSLKVHAYVYMTNHIHLIVSSNAPLENIIRDFKRHTAKEFVKAIKEHPESRREWLLNKFNYEAKRIKRGKNHKVWKDGFHPVILDTPYKLEQRLNYIHQNPLELQLVEHMRDWVNSSYKAYEDEKYISNVELEVLK